MLGSLQKLIKKKIRPLDWNLPVVLRGQVSTKVDLNTLPAFIFSMTLQNNGIKDKPCPYMMFIELHNNQEPYLSSQIGIEG